MLNLQKNMHKIKNKIEKLTKTEFYDVYGISLLRNRVEANYLLACLLPIARKYYKITSYAVRAELRHFVTSGDSYGKYYYESLKEVKHVFKKLGIKNWKLERRKLPLKMAYELFMQDFWDGSYGGVAWANICDECMNLKKALKEKNLNHLLISLDRLNDLEHNNALYLQTYSTFDLEQALDDKYNAQTEYIFAHCSSDIRKIARGTYA